MVEEDIEKEKKAEVKEVVDVKTTTPYIIVRWIEVLCIGAFVFGFLWNGTEVLNLTTPQFMMLYGGTGALLSEIIARIFKKKVNIR